MKIALFCAPVVAFCFFYIYFSKTKEIVPYAQNRAANRHIERLCTISHAMGQCMKIAQFCIPVITFFLVLFCWWFLFLNDGRKLCHAQKGWIWLQSSAHDTGIDMIAIFSFRVGSNTDEIFMHSFPFPFFSPHTLSVLLVVCIFVCPMDRLFFFLFLFVRSSTRSMSVSRFSSSV